MALVSLFSALFPRRDVQIAKVFQALADLAFQAPQRGVIEVRGGFDFVGKVMFARGIGLRFVVGVAVGAAETQFLHEPGRRIAQVDRDRP